MVVSTVLGKEAASVLGIPETTSASHLRNLREAGLLTKTGRGTSAAHMTTHDAALLLIAAAASPNVKDSVETVHAFQTLKSKYGRPRIDLARYANIDDDHTFVDALIALLDAAAHNELAQKDDFKVRLFGPIVKAEIKWKRAGSTDFSFAEYIAPSAENWLQSRGKPKPLGLTPDLERRAAFGEFTILQLGALIGGPKN